MIQLLSIRSEYDIQILPKAACASHGCSPSGKMSIDILDDIEPPGQGQFLDAVLYVEEKVSPDYITISKTLERKGAFLQRM